MGSGIFTGETRGLLWGAGMAWGQNSRTTPPMELQPLQGTPSQRHFRLASVFLCKYYLPPLCQGQCDTLLTRGWLQRPLLVPNLNTASPWQKASTIPHGASKATGIQLGGKVGVNDGTELRKIKTNIRRKKNSCAKFSFRALRCLRHKLH